MGDRIAVLNGGVIQQLGTPQDLYDSPANLFVAGFIGSPAMDFFDARLIRRDGGNPAVVISESADAATIAVTGHAAGQVAGQAAADGRKVVVGIRPEGLHLAGADEADTLSGVVEVVEHLGNEQLVYLKVHGARAASDAESQGTIARLPAGAGAQVGQRLTLAVDTAKLHIFDPASSKRFI